MNDIKSRQFKNVYLLYGEESYLKRFYKNKLKEAVLGEGDTMNMAVFDAGSFDVHEVMGLCDTMPFFAEHRLVLAQDTGLFKTGDDELIAYIDRIPDTTVLVFVEDVVDKRGRMYKAVAKRGRVVDMARLTPAELEKWVMAALKKNDRRISGRAFELFLSKVGDSLENVDKELEKLVDYTYGRDAITQEDVEAVCTVQVESKVFDMIDAMVAGKSKSALDLYYDLLTLKEPPMRILFLIARQYNLLLKTRLLMDDHASKAETASGLGVAEWLAAKYMRMAGGYSSGWLEECVRDCVQAEEDVKTGRMNDKLSVELIITRFSRK